MVEETTSPLVVEDTTSPLVVEETTSPLVVEETTSPLVVEDTTSTNDVVATVEIDSKPSLLEYVSSREAQSMNTKRSDLLNKYSESEIELALNDDSIIEFRGFLYTNG